MKTTLGVGVVLQFAALLLVGTGAATVLAAATVAGGFALDQRRSSSLPRWGVELLAAVAAAQAAGLSYTAVSNAFETTWPQQAAAISVSVLLYAIVKGVAGEFVAPMIRREPVSPDWPYTFANTLQNLLIAATIAAGVAELVEQRMWGLLIVALVPLYCVYRMAAAYHERVDAEQRQREVIAKLGAGLAVLDRSGRVSVWTEALEQICDIPRERVLGHTLTAALPALAKNGLQRAIDAALGGSGERTVHEATLPNPAGARAVEITVTPFDDGATLIFQDVTERRRAERELKRQEERLALAASGANDALWEWDLATKEFYASRRWQEMLGLAAEDAIGPPEEWLGRVHPEDIGALKEALEAHLTGKSESLRHEHRVRHEDGTYRWFMCNAVASQNASRRSVRIGGSFTDTTERVIVQDRLRSAGFLDPLTNLCNRSLFVEGLGRRLQEYKESRVGGRFALLYLDLDRFKVVNDSLGHLVGDELLVAVSRRLESCVRPGDALARLGGDEFAILMNSLTEDQQANALAFRIQETLRAPINIGGRDVFTSASIGIAFGPAQYNDPDEIMRDADTAMYHAKSRGKARHEVFDADMHARVRDRLGLESDLRHAVRGNDFEVHYQPIVSLASGMCVGFESLVRWNRNGEPVSPATFIPMAEELGLIDPLGTFVMQEACRTFADWQRRFPDAGLDYITVNVSSRQLVQHNFLRMVERAVHEAGLNPSDLRIEITETALMDSPAVASELLSELRDFGVKIYLDDFGTGYSSLSHLHKLPVDALKIDRSFVKSLLLPDRPAIVESVLALARTLNTSVVAEGIESDRQAHELERLGCTHAQGFLFSRPLSQQKAEALITAHQPLGPKRVPLVEMPVTDTGILVPSGPFEWPAHIPVR